MLLDKMRGGLLGLAAGDALGVPAEFCDRKQLKKNPVTDMTGWGTHSQPPGTWSDDTGMTLAALDSLAGGFDPEDMMRRFRDWRDGAYWPYGEVFDVGIATSEEKGLHIRRTGILGGHTGTDLPPSHTPMHIHVQSRLG